MDGKLNKLSEEACANFDTEYIEPAYYMQIVEFIKKEYPEGVFKFLDVGGGNGIFVDKLLLDFPKSEGVLIDNSIVLTNANKKNTRKQIIVDSFENMNEYCTEKEFDLVFCNWVLHHFVGDTYNDSVENIQSALKLINKMLKKGGNLIVNENLCKGYVSDALSSRIVFWISSSKILAPIARKFGSNSAGCGVCYFYERFWNNLTVRVGGYSLKGECKLAPHEMGFKKRIVFLLKELYMKGFIFVNEEM